MASHHLLFKGFILLSLSSLHPQASLQLTVERIEAELSTLYTRPAAEEEEKRLINNQHYETSIQESERMITEARMHWREGHFREVANLFADILERDSGNATIRRYLHRTYEKLYPLGPTPRKPKTPAMDAFRAAMKRAMRPEGVSIPGTHTVLRAEALDGQEGSFAPLFIVRDFLSPSEVTLLRTHTSDRFTETGPSSFLGRQSPIVCLTHNDFKKSAIFQRHAIPGHPYCLDSRASQAISASKALGLERHSSVSLSVWEGRESGNDPTSATRAGTIDDADDVDIRNLFAALEGRVEALMGLSRQQAYNHQLLVYPEGAEYASHTDCTVPEDRHHDAVAHLSADGTRGGGNHILRKTEDAKHDRAFTTLALLSDDFDGGETIFPELLNEAQRNEVRAMVPGNESGGKPHSTTPAYSLRVRAGDLLVWSNVELFSLESSSYGSREYRCSPRMAHAGSQVRLLENSKPKKPYTCSSIAGGSSADSDSDSLPLAGHKIVWQRWYSMLEIPFQRERRAWEFKLPTRRPYQPILGCDTVGEASRKHLSELRAGSASTSCRLYSEWPYANPDHHSSESESEDIASPQ